VLFRSVGEVTQRRLDWLVPGMVREKVEGLIRELPKALRASFVPVPQTVDGVMARLKFGRGDFFEAVTGALRETTNIFVGREQWHPERLPKHLSMNIRVVDVKGRIVMGSRDLAAIRREFAGQAEQSLVRLPEGPLNRSGIYHWDFGVLPESAEIEFGGRVFTVYPALNDERGDEEVAIRPFVSADKAKGAHAAGLRRLFYLHTRRECRSLMQTMPGIEKLGLMYRGLASAKYAGVGNAPLVEQLAELTGHRAWAGTGDVRNKEAFDKGLNAAWTRIGAAGLEVFGLAEGIVKEHAAVAARMEEAEGKVEWAAAVLDVRVQLAYLLGAEFWTRTPFEWLRQYPRYLGAVRRRLDRLGGIDGVARDLKLMNEIAPWVLKLRVRVEQGAPSQRADPELVKYRWMLEEWRVALWGERQETIVPVSAKRVEEQWGRVAAK
jgi:ATP-dependent helicase HrpA